MLQPTRTIVFILFILSCWGSVCHAQSASQAELLRLWYVKPAENWNEALPIGNGRLGAMVFGGAAQERLQLNEETVWAGGPGNNLPDNRFREALPELRKLIFEGKYQEAQDLATQKVAGPNVNHGMPYQTVGDLFIDFPGHDAATGYTRDLNIDQAVASTAYTVGNVQYTREVFASFTDQVIVMKVTAGKGGTVDCTIRLKSPHTSKRIYTEGQRLVLTGTSSSHEGKTGQVKFEALVTPVLDGGKLTTTDSTLIVSKARAVTVYISMGTNFRNYHDLSGDAHQKTLGYLATALKQPYARAKSNHTAYYQKFFHRVSLDLGVTPATKQPIPARLQQFATGNDPQLAALYFQFGRYLLISASQPGTQPATLQGLWNHQLMPPWDSKYTININTEMNYWPAEVTDLPEMHEPLFTLLKELAVTGQASAKEMYGARGWMAHHNTDLWRITGPVDGAFYGMWPMGGAWLSQHLWQHYQYTGDVNFLKSVYHVLKGAALFYADALQTEPSHEWLVVVPSMSPENEHRRGVSMTAGATMDNQLVFDVFSNFLGAAALLRADQALADSIRVKLGKLPPMQIGKHGQLQEWLEDLDRPDDKHRHVSHLYGLYPGNQVSPYRNPALFQAARTSLVYRGDKSTGWSMGWKVNWWARLQDGDRAYKLMQDQLTPSHDNEGGTYPNLLDAHPPFQIDGNFGCTSGIAEMLVQSHDGAVHLLPALPDAWHTGKVKGLKTRGGFTIDLDWKDGKISRLVVKSALGGKCRLRVYDALKHAGFQVAQGANGNPFFAVADVKAPVVVAAPGQGEHVRRVYEYDLATEAGKVYTFSF
jgi:alpha-L-fucosidase 2